jgi:lipopolysaccharide export LptBFGC system permease protein LptF
MVYKRKSGFECPWSYQQLFSFIIYFCALLVFSVIIWPNYSKGKKVVLGSLSIISYVVLLVVLVVLTLSDSSDPIVNSYLSSNDEK